MIRDIYYITKDPIVSALEPGARFAYSIQIALVLALYREDDPVDKTSDKKDLLVYTAQVDTKEEDPFQNQSVDHDKDVTYTFLTPIEPRDLGQYITVGNYFENVPKTTQSLINTKTAKDVEIWMNLHLDSDGFVQNRRAMNHAYDEILNSIINDSSDSAKTINVLRKEFSNLAQSMTPIVERVFQLKTRLETLERHLFVIDPEFLKSVPHEVNVPN